MPKPCTLTVLAENSARGRNLMAEHGLAFWLTFGEQHFLLDTGQGLVLRHNAKTLGVDLTTADGLVLSHGHYDHTGDLASLLAEMDCPVYAHPSAFQPRYARNADGTCRSVGVAGAEAMGELLATRLRPVEAPTELTHGLWVTGPVPRVCEFENECSPFVLDPDGNVPDPLTDDQSVFYRSGEGTVVLLGCAHSGVMNTLRHIRQLTEDAPIHTVVGGMHLGSASPVRIEQTVKALLELGVARIAPLHCTGVAASHAIRSAFGESCLHCPVGTTLELPPALG